MGWLVGFTPPVQISPSVCTQCLHRKTRFITDAQKRIIAVLVGHPNDPGWKIVAKDAAALMEEVRMLGLESDAFDEKYITHRRGDFVAIPVGISYGGGGTVSLSFHFIKYAHQLLAHFKKPGNLVHTKARRRLIQKLLDSPSIQRIAGFQSSKLYLHCCCSSCLTASQGAFAAFAPKLQYFSVPHSFL